MPWRLIQFIVVFAVFLLFIVFNLENRSDISLGFYTFRSVPVFLTAFIAFIFGMLLTLPFIVTFWLKARKGDIQTKKPDKRDGAAKPAPASKPGPAPVDKKDYGID